MLNCRLVESCSSQGLYARLFEHCLQVSQHIQGVHVHQKKASTNMLCQAGTGHPAKRYQQGCCQAQAYINSCATAVL